MPAIIIPEAPELVMAYDRINQFYKIWSLPVAHNYLNKFLKSAQADKAGRFSVPNFLFFREELEELIHAALCLHHADAEHPDVVPDITCFHQYCNHRLQLKPWHYFPRSLNLKEYANPYKVFSRVARFGDEKAWKKILNDLLYYCYSPNSCSEVVDRPNILKLSACLQKLLEATHLVVVRGINEKSDGEVCISDISPIQNKEENNETIHASEAAACTVVQEDTDQEDPPENIMSDEEISWQVIKEFFQCWHPDDFEADTWNITKKALTNDLDETEAGERDRIILVFEKLKELIPAVHTLYQIQFTKTN